VRHGRAACGVAGLAALGAAALPGDATLTAHMAEHQLMTVVAAPLLVAAAPVRAALRRLGPSGRRALVRVLRSAPVRRLGHPAAALAAFVAVLAVVHVPAVFDAAERVPLLHALEHGALFWSSVALWVPVLGAPPVPHSTGAVGRVATVIGAMAAMGVLGAVLAAAPSPLYAAYPELADQQRAGGLMWIGGMVVALPLLVAGAWSALAAEERRQRAREARW